MLRTRNIKIGRECILSLPMQKVQYPLGNNVRYTTLLLQFARSALNTDNTIHSEMCFLFVCLTYDMEDVDWNL